MKSVVVDRRNCICCGNCTRVCPKIFEIVDGASMPKNEVLDLENDTESVDRAIAECPVNVISWSDGESSSSEKTLSEKSEKKSGGFFQKLFGKKEKTEFALLSRKKLTEDVEVFTFESPQKDFIPGQFFTFSFSDSEGDFTRSYSVLSASEKEISFCIHLTPDGRGSNALRQLHIGEKVKIVGPFGKFSLSESKNPKVFVATGTGITPIFSMLQSRDISIPAKLFFGVRHESDFFLTDEIRNFSNLQTFFTLSSLSESSDIFCAGRVTDLLKNDDFSDDAEFYLCGNPKMVEEGKKILLNRGVEEEKIFFEHFS